ncbi:FecR family protein [Chitinophaga sp. 22321]|uniref:FecR domain-containing protein n=1 Tax=Chitinophaga hostae TaxID=2831022 RepID=A0ABS5J5M2_9BACT|nr:FecR family protein [Chitinophaga hostae]MBS0030518.1 FecR domain-containing protein [Chitinophaga hostae]
MDIGQVKALLEKYRTGKSSPEEKEIVEQWYALLVNTGEWEWSDGEKEQLEQAMEAKLLQQIRTTDGLQRRSTFFQKTAGWWAAATIICVLTAGARFLFFNTANKHHTSALPSPRFKNDILPAKQQVMLTLSDGTQKALDDVSNGTVSLPGMPKAVKKDSSITYASADRTSGGEVVYNTIATGKGRTFRLQLSDGSDVWLDALSSIRFPTSFPGTARIVETTGQVYFEVAHNAQQCFKVKSGKQVVEVLGTHFNINSFNGDVIQTTLLEGSLRVQASANVLSGNNTGNSIVIKPGQQATFSSQNPKLTTQELQNMDEVMAWKEGRFRFDGSSIENITAQLSRWYNIDVIYKDKITETFVADITRDLPISKVLELLEMTKQVKFVINGNKVTVTKW